MKKIYNVDGMSCRVCKEHVEKAAKKIPGVTAAVAEVVTGILAVEGSFDEEELKSSISKAGYRIVSEKKSSNKRPEIRSFAVSLALLICLVLVSMGSMGRLGIVSRIIGEKPLIFGCLQLVLSLSVIIINGRFFVSGFRAAARLMPNMDTLVTLGSACSFIYSTVILVSEALGKTPYNSDLWFESAAMIPVFISFGKMLEAGAKRKAEDAVGSLVSMAPDRCNLISGDGSIIICDTGDVRVGDIIMVKPGEQVPLDGVIISGETLTDESMLTGENLPVTKMPGDKVFCGTLNINGGITLRVTSENGSTTIDRLAALVKEAGAGKTPVSRLADRIAAVFVPVIIGISLITLAAWLIAGEELGVSLIRAVSVLVVSCPCAMGLATPVAIICGNTVAAKNNVLFKTAKTMEAAAKVKTVFLDKTGTLTKAEMRVESLKPEGITLRELAEIGAAAEKQGNHPIGRGIVNYYNENFGEGPLAEVTGYRELPGKGAEAYFNGALIRLGTEDFACPADKADKSDKEDKADKSDKADKADKMGKADAESSGTAVYISRDGVFIGKAVLRDEIREGSEKAIGELKKLGIRTVILTGDNEKEGERVRALTGADECLSGLMPEDKIRIIEGTENALMCGDGINDAPALARASVGVAMGAGTDIAIESADAIILKNDLLCLAGAIKLAKKTLRIIKLNLFWAFAYNIIGIPLAAGVLGIFTGFYLKPEFCALAMSFSSVFVVTNSLRLLKEGKKCFGTEPGEGEITVKESESKKMITTTVEVSGMMCPKCEKHVNDAVTGNFSVISCVSDHGAGRTVIVSNEPLDEDKLRKIIEAEDYEVGKITTD